MYESLHANAVDYMAVKWKVASKDAKSYGKLNPKDQAEKFVRLFADVHVQQAHVYTTGALQIQEAAGGEEAG